MTGYVALTAALDSVDFGAGMNVITAIGAKRHRTVIPTLAGLVAGPEGPAYSFERLTATRPTSAAAAAAETSGTDAASVAATASVLDFRITGLLGRRAALAPQRPSIAPSA
ncbi:MAG: hypothetical protein E4H44_00765 [Candidatus Aminicenantes bacterium]|nr:MAG: hypothetical protein E4H44_00765 [Candidatus Aminicenantes bacterium]